MMDQDEGENQHARPTNTEPFVDIEIGDTQPAATSPTIDIRNRAQNQLVLKDLQSNIDILKQWYPEYSKEIDGLTGGISPSAIANGNFLIGGNSRIGLAGNTLTFFTGFAALALFGATFSKSKKIGPIIKSILISTPSVSGSLLRLFAGPNTDVTGGRKSALWLLATANLGMGGLTALAYLTDPAKLTTGSWQFPAWIIAGTLAGAGIATFPNGTAGSGYWYPKAEVGFARGVYGGVGNLAPGIFALILPHIINEYGLANAYSMWLGLLAAETGITFLLLKNSPMHQLRNAGISDEHARIIAKAAGQEQLPKSTKANQTCKELMTSPLHVLALLKEPKNCVLTGAYFLSFGGFVAMTQYLPTYYQDNHDKDKVSAMTATGIYSILASLSRVAGGEISDHWLGGANTTQLGMVGILVGSALLAKTTSGLSGWDISGLLFMAIGGGLANAGIFKWISTLQTAGLGNVDGLVGGLGATGGFIITVLLGVIAESINSGETDGMLIFGAMAALSIVANEWLKDKSQLELNDTTSQTAAPPTITSPIASQPTPLLWARSMHTEERLRSIQNTSENELRPANLEISSLSGRRNFDIR